MEDVRILKALNRIAHSNDSVELFEYFENLSKDNYKLLKSCDPSFREMYVGRAQMIDEIKDFFHTVDSKIRDLVKEDVSGWSL